MEYPSVQQSQSGCWQGWISIHSAGENDVVFIEEENLEDSATKMDILEVRDNHKTEQNVAIAEEMNVQPIKLNVANVANKKNYWQAASIAEK